MVAVQTKGRPWPWLARRWPGRQGRRAVRQRSGLGLWLGLGLRLRGCYRLVVGRGQRGGWPCLSLESPSPRCITPVALHDTDISGVPARCADGALIGGAGPAGHPKPGRIGVDSAADREHVAGHAEAWRKPGGSQPPDPLAARCAPPAPPRAPASRGVGQSAGAAARLRHGCLPARRPPRPARVAASAAAELLHATSSRLALDLSINPASRPAATRVPASLVRAEPRGRCVPAQTTRRAEWAEGLSAA